MQNNGSSEALSPCLHALCAQDVVVLDALAGGHAAIPPAKTDEHRRAHLLHVVDGGAAPHRYDSLWAGGLVGGEVVRALAAALHHAPICMHFEATLDR